MSKLIFAVRQLTISNLSWFHVTRTTVGEAAGRERAININKPVLKKWFPEAHLDTEKLLLITTKYLRGESVDNLSNQIVTDDDRPIGLQGGGSNWRLGGEAIPGAFYGSLRTNDLMLMMFDTKIKELRWFPIRGNQNNSFGRTSVPNEEDEAFNKIIILLGIFNASRGMWLPDFETSVKILLQAFKINEKSWQLLNVENFMAQKIVVTGYEPSAANATPETPKVSFPKNRILYGAPGTGKSKQLSIDVGDEGVLFKEIRRVTFYPDYTYGQFVGSYKPFPVYRKEDNVVDYTNVDQDFGHEPMIDYRLVPGPFLEILGQAILNPGKNYLLIIEEINRAVVASVFGDIFQLLDRETDEREPYYGGSAYSIAASAEIRAYLNRLFGNAPSAAGKSWFADEFSRTGTLRIPANLYIWATMNSADQGVMPLDSAFKRRWSFEYIALDEGKEVTETWRVNFMGREMSWNALRECINNYLTADTSFRVAEDKLLGPFFMGIAELLDSKAVNNKLLLYLKDDVLRHAGSGLFFRKENSTLSRIFRAAANDQKAPEDRIRDVFCDSLAEQILLLKITDTASDESAEASLE